MDRQQTRRWWKVIAGAPVLLLAACAPPPTSPACPTCPACPQAQPPTLRLHNQQLYIAAAPEGTKRGTSLFYVAAAAPLPGTTTPPRVGIVHAVDHYDNVLLVAWSCPPDRPEDAAIPETGLPVTLVGQNEQPKFGRCLSSFDVKQTDACAAGACVDLQINLGKNDGIKDMDRYEVLGAAVADATARTVIGFDKLGECIIQQDGLADEHAICRLDRTLYGGPASRPFPNKGLIQVMPRPASLP